MPAAKDRYDPDLPPEEFRQLGYRAVDLLTDYFSTIDARRVFPTVEPETIVDRFDQSVPETGQDPNAILDEWQDILQVQGAFNTSPRFFGYVMGSGTMIGTLAEALAAGLNLNVFGWPTAPSATEIERRCIEWLAEAVDYPVGRGVLTSGGTMANVSALLAAFRAQAGIKTAGTGLQAPDQPGPYTLYMADHEGHSSIVQAAQLLNLGREAVRRVPSNDDFTMNVDALEHLLEADKADGATPFCVIAQVGSINVSVIDPLDMIADLCEDHDLWLHADGACGGVGAMVPEWQDRYVGLARADSLTMDPHKWLGIPYECGSVMVRDSEALRRAFVTEAGYLKGSVSGRPEDLYLSDHGPQLSRGFRALKLWMTMKHFGLEGYRELLRQTVDCARHLHDCVSSHPDFATLQEPNLYIYSFQYVPADLGATIDSIGDSTTDRVHEYLDELNQAIVDDIVHSGVAFLTTTLIRGRRTLRMSVCSFRTTRADIDLTFDAIAESGRRIDDEWRESAALPL